MNLPIKKQQHVIVEYQQSNNLDIEEGGQPRLPTLTLSDDVEQQTMPAVFDQSNQPRRIVGLEQVDGDDSDLPLPMGMAEDISNRAEPPKQKGSKIEQLEDDNGPELPVATLEASLNSADITTLKGSATDMNHSSTYAAALTEALQSGKINLKEVEDIINSFKDTPTTTNTEYINELNSPPVPFDSAEFEQDAIAKKIAKEEMNQKPTAITNNTVVLPPSNRDSIYEPSREIIDGEEGMSDNTNTGRGGTNRRGWGDIESRVARRDIESQTRANNDDHEDAGNINNDSMIDTESNVVLSIDQETEDIAIHIPEAFLVEDIDEEVFIATPTLPWWKQRRTKIFFGVVVLLLGTMAIALGVLLSRPNNSTTVNMIVNGTDAPSVSLAPSSSSAPSSSPTECVNKIISNRQEIDLIKDLQINDPRDPKVAVDGRNMVVVAIDGKYYTTADDDRGGDRYDGPAYVTFYSLDINDEWQRVQPPIRVDDVGSVVYSVSLSGSTVFVGFPYLNNNTGDVLVYELNQFSSGLSFKLPIQLRRALVVILISMEI